MIEVAGRLREALAAAEFTYDGVASALGTTAHSALGRNETLPGLRATDGDSALETLTRLWLLQAPVPVEAVERALPGLVGPLVAAGLLEQSGGEVRALLDVRPYAADDADLWVVSDLTPGMDGRPIQVAPDHVLGISPASTSLAQLTVREPIARALDLGTGCGVQALHLAGHAEAVVATDVNPRALALTRFNAALNEVEVETREGSFFEPVGADLFDLVVSNPPFVVSPGSHAGRAGRPQEPLLVYRDSGMPGDSVVEQVVRRVQRHLAPGGVVQVVANWAIERDRPWQERLGPWVEDCDAWVVQREVLDLPAYVELWLKDAGLHGGPDYHERYDIWLSWLEQQGIEAIGFGWISLRRTDAEPHHRLEEWRYEVEQPMGPEVAAHWRRADALRALSDADLLAQRLVMRPDLRQETHGDPGAEDPAQVVLRQQRWMRRARQADTVEAALVGACDGELSVGQILDALGVLVQRVDLRAAYLPVVRELIAEGFLEPQPTTVGV